MSDLHYASQESPSRGGKAPRHDEKAANVLFAQAQTRRLEALGVVLGNSNGESFICRPCQIGQHEGCVNTKPLHPHPSRGRKRIYLTAYARLKAYRRKRSRMITK